LELTLDGRSWRLGRDLATAQSSIRRVPAAPGRASASPGSGSSTSARP
jgi:hypothetical protein